MLRRARFQASLLRFLDRSGRRSGAGSGSHNSSTKGSPPALTPQVIIRVYRASHAVDRSDRSLWPPHSVGSVVDTPRPIVWKLRGEEQDVVRASHVLPAPLLIHSLHCLAAFNREESHHLRQDALAIGASLLACAEFDVGHCRPPKSRSTARWVWKADLIPKPTRGPASEDLRRVGQHRAGDPVVCVSQGALTTCGDERRPATSGSLECAAVRSSSNALCIALLIVGIIPSREARLVRPPHRPWRANRSRPSVRETRSTGCRRTRTRPSRQRPAS